MSVEQTVDETLLNIHRNRWHAHLLLFPHRRTEASADVHEEIVRRIYRPDPRGLIEGFRGVSKSTHLEEAAVIKAAFREFENMVIVGSSYERACERLASIKREIEQNETLEVLFGRLKGLPWQEGKIVLSTGVCIQALGRDQSMDGIKHFDKRPDAALVDDVEDPEEKRNDTERHQTWIWFIRTFLPSLDHPLYSWVRVLGTRRGTGSLPERLEASGWPTAKFPIEHINNEGVRTATWPGKFPLPIIDQMKHHYRGDLATWNQEYMCRATSDEARTFTREMLRVDPRPRSWEAVYAMYDPARTTGPASATTGKAVWSWIRNRLVFWKIDAQLWRPDEIIEDIYDTNYQYQPTWIGFEKTGLSEWAMQPIRQEGVKRGIILPLKGIDAPRGKLDFIRGLQPFFSAREVIFAETPAEEVIAQFLSFPAGRIDAPNAAAYALLMRPGAAVYDNFNDDNIAEGLDFVPGRPIFLAANATGGLVTAVLCQAVDGGLRVLADWVREGSPAEVCGDIHMEASNEGDTAHPVSRRWNPVGLDEALKNPRAVVRLERTPVRWVTPPRHMDHWNNVGLMQAVRSIPAQVQQGLAEDMGRAELRELLGRMSRGNPAVLVSDRARWTLNAFAGGYCRAVLRGGGVADHAEEGVYRVLMEGLESFCAMMARQADDAADDDRQNIAFDAHGRPYKSAMPARRR